MPSCSVLSLILFFALSVLLSTSASLAAKPEIFDPEQRLQNLSFGEKRPEFKQAFRCDESLTVFTKMGQCKVFCEFGVCEQHCRQEEIVEADFYPSECNDEQVMLYSTKGHILTATAIDYQTSSNSIALTILNSISIFFDNIEKIEINFVGHGLRKNLIENGKIKPVFLSLVEVSIFPDRNKNGFLNLTLFLDLNQSGLDQLMCLSEQGSCEPKQSYLMKRKGLANAQH